MGDTTTGDLALREALTVERDGDDLVASVADGWDVFGITHGGYVAALAGAAFLAAGDEPDLFTVTLHYLRKVDLGELRLRVEDVGGSRRFRSRRLVATQDGRPVLTGLASVGTRSDVEGPTDVEPAWEPTDLSPPAGSPGLPFDPPAIAHRFGMRFEQPSAPFAVGETVPRLPLRAVLDTTEPDQLTALLACDVTPPAVWNTLGARGWVPTLELTAHVRATPAPGPLRVEARTNHVTDGVLEEDALVHDATGRLVVQSRQLALWTA